MDSTPTSVYRINPLKGLENYPVWKIQMMDILTDLGLWGYVSRDMSRPAQGMADETAKWAWKD